MRTQPSTVISDGVAAMREIDKNFNNEWTPHEGGAIPVAAEVLVEVRYRDAVVSDPVRAKQRRWESWPSDLGDTAWDIVQWRRVRR